MDLNSPEFYTIAFVVAMALVALLMGHREKQPPSTHIVQLLTEAGEESDPDVVTMEPMENGRLQVRRTGIALGAEETVNLVITIQEDNCTIIEKKGIKRRSAIAQPVVGEAVLKCLRPGLKYRMRYESQLTSAWATFTLDTTSPHPIKATMKY